MRILKKRRRSINMEQKKYKLTKETMCFDGVTLHRIQAIKDFGDVTAGEHGGWVESERNLSQKGNCWINMEAKAYGYAEICDNAVLTNGAIACGNSIIGNDTSVTDESVIRGFTHLFGNVEVSGKSVIDGYAKLYGHVMVIGAKIIDAEVCDNVVICDGAYVHGHIKINGNAYISNGAEVRKTDDYIVFKNFWSSGRHFTWTRSNNKWHVGCFRGTGEELIKKAYQDSEKSGREYERVVRYVESILADEQYDTAIVKYQDIERIVSQTTDEGAVRYYAVYNDKQENISELIPVSKTVLSYINACKQNQIEPSLAIHLKNGIIVGLIRYKTKYIVKRKL